MVETWLRNEKKEKHKIKPHVPGQCVRRIIFFIAAIRTMTRYNIIFQRESGYLMLASLYPLLKNDSYIIHGIKYFYCIWYLYSQEEEHPPVNIVGWQMERQRRIIVVQPVLTLHLHSETTLGNPIRTPHSPKLFRLRPVILLWWEQKVPTDFFKMADVFSTISLFKWFRYSWIFGMSFSLLVSIFTSRPFHGVCPIQTTVRMMELGVT